MDILPPRPWVHGASISLVRPCDFPYWIRVSDPCVCNLSMLGYLQNGLRVLGGCHMLRLRMFLSLPMFGGIHT